MYSITDCNVNGAVIPKQACICTGSSAPVCMNGLPNRQHTQMHHPCGQHIIVLLCMMGMQQCKSYWTMQACRNALIMQKQYHLSLYDCPTGAVSWLAILLLNTEHVHTEHTKNTHHCAVLQEEDAAVWELLGYATLIWHTATGQQNSAPAEQQAAKQVFDYWSSRQAWLVSKPQQTGF